jgi:hypothetical protein
MVISTTQEELMALRSDTSAAAAARIIDCLIQNQIQCINPDIDLSHMLEKKYSSSSKLPLVSFDADPALWASLRSKKQPSNAAVSY